ncbi:GTPase HflX [Candidatus Bathyarchaeota archaeon]|nr:GTPase HflX [Candidatus Bathyarchaeota archaeon]
MDELTSLAESAGYVVVASIEQMRRADARFQIGRGKAEELAKLVKDLDATKIIFDNDLKSIQSYNLATVTGIETIDRFQLILEIFAKRASTQEAMFQIKLANLQYQLPRVKASVKLAKMGERPGFLGLGMYEVDIHFNAIKKQIATIRKELKRISKQRDLHRLRRIESSFLHVSLAGYTNSGKTTLFNALTREAKSVNPGLFTTLSTTTRSVFFQDKKALITDTVGFIDRLPIIMVNAFHSTLEETTLSDAIILIIDFHESLEEIKRKLLVCLNTLKEIGTGGIPIITALNKIDLLKKDEIQEKLHSISNDVSNPILISALKEINLDELKKSVATHLGNYLKIAFLLPLNDSTLSFISRLYTQVGSLETYYTGKEIKVVVTASPLFMDKISGQIKKLEGKLLLFNETEKDN